MTLINPKINDYYVLFYGDVRFTYAPDFMRISAKYYDFQKSYLYDLLLQATDVETLCKIDLKDDKIGVKGFLIVNLFLKSYKDVSFEEPRDILHGEYFIDIISWKLSTTISKEDTISKESIDKLKQLFNRNILYENKRADTEKSVY